MDGILPVIVLAYTGWAIYSGWKFVTNRIPALNERKGLVIAAKVVLSVVIGYVIGAITLAIGIFTLFHHLSK